LLAAATITANEEQIGITDRPHDDWDQESTCFQGEMFMKNLDPLIFALKAPISANTNDGNVPDDCSDDNDPNDDESGNDYDDIENEFVEVEDIDNSDLHPSEEFSPLARQRCSPFSLQVDQLSCLT